MSFSSGMISINCSTMNCAIRWVAAFLVRWRIVTAVLITRSSFPRNMTGGGRLAGVFFQQLGDRHVEDLLPAIEHAQRQVGGSLLLGLHLPQADPQPPGDGASRNPLLPAYRLQAMELPDGIAPGGPPGSYPAAVRPAARPAPSETAERPTTGPASRATQNVKPNS